MRRWLYFVVSCTAAFGIACGGDESGGSDGGNVIDARVGDAGADARLPDAATPAADARLPDASTPDARPPDANVPPPADAGPDAVVCNSDPECTHAGANCQDDGSSQNCTLQAGTTNCFKKSGTADTCGTHESCKENAGCTCDNDATCTEGAGTYCGAAETVITCEEDADGCFTVAEADPTQCVGPQTCQGSPGDAACDCPSEDTGLAGSSCDDVAVNARRCSANNGAVLVCVVESTSGGNCHVWDDGTAEWSQIGRASCRERV